VIGYLINDDREYVLASESISRQWAAFGEVGLRVTPRLRMSVGGRHFDYTEREDFWQIDQYFGIDARDENGLARTIPLPEERSFGRARNDGEIFRLNGSFDLTRDKLVYVTIAQGFRPGGANQVTESTGVPEDQRDYDPDSIVSHELGGKFAFADNRFYLSTAAFYIDWSDIQTEVPTGLGFSTVGNAGKATARGLELELHARKVFAAGLTLVAGYTFIDVKLEETTLELGYAGDRAPRVPRHSGSLLADYHVPASNGWIAALNFLVTHTGSSATTFGPVRPNAEGQQEPDPFYMEQKGYWLATTSVRLQNDRWTVRLFADNLFDERVDLNRVAAPFNSPYRGSYVVDTVNRPRRIGIELTRRFGAAR
jgi:iron complex outermembrane recepter protein